MAKKPDPETLFEDAAEREAQRPVECFGMTFENDEARRAYFLDKLREKLKDPEFRKIEGFPVGEDEDILALSDPPYYTACPNPFLGDFIKHYGKPYDPETDDYRREPFAADVSEGKTDPIYNAHSYHTKVPHKAIMRYILHYTEPGDIVYDGFCGSGMTGVAAQLCGDRQAVGALGYSADKTGVLTDEFHRNSSKLGKRRTVLNDLSPAATFIAGTLNASIPVSAFEARSRDLLMALRDAIGWMYLTTHTDGRSKGTINYTVWSEVFTCPQCAGELVFSKEAFDNDEKKIKDSFACPHCAKTLSKSDLDLVYNSFFDNAVGMPSRAPKRVPVLINYSVGPDVFQKEPDDDDLELLRRVEELPQPNVVPMCEMPDMQMMRVGRMRPSAITHLHHFFLARARFAMAALWHSAQAEGNYDVRRALIFLVEQAIWGLSVLARYVPTHYSQVNQYLSGVFYVASHVVDVSPWYILRGKLRRLVKVFGDVAAARENCLTSTQDLGCLNLPANSVDYIFTDPPFGENIYYADLNFLVESWHGVKTAPTREAIVDRVRGKALPDYQELMGKCFERYFMALKPGRWMTVEFHNSRNSVWMSIQEALQRAGFVIADVRVLDKKQGSFQQISSRKSVKQDLVISAYKPNGGLERRFELGKGTEEGAWDFIRTHLKQLPVFVSKDGEAEVLAERQDFLLFDRMVAFHVQRGVTIPVSAPEFYEGLAQRFPERDGMYFLPEQVPEYDKKRMKVKEVLQLQLFVTDEASAIQWLKQQLTKKPQTFQEVHPQFLKEIGGWNKNEKALELSELLEQNFLRCDGQGEVPSQIHSYLSTNFKELRNKRKDDPGLRAKAKDRWYVPDPNKAGDLEKLRDRALLREFWDYLPAGYKPAKPESQEGFIPGLEPKPTPIPKGKKMKVIRLEAVRAGFKQCWQDRDYRTIIAVAQRIPENVLQEDPKLLMWYDQALTRTGGHV